MFENHSIMYHPPQQGKTHIYTVANNLFAIQIRIEILFDRQSTKNLKSGTLQALQNEIEQRLKPHYPEIWLRIDQGSAPSVSVTGARNDKGKERIQSLLEEIWQDDSWLPAA
ncbi:DinI-like family protein [Escherichia coli]|uniref:DinI-like family protein n=1 Tax=Escherichia coli TaxID=562 RepID=UPI001CC938B9|nr:DinI-like family protein [Escherichia coli]